VWIAAQASQILNSPITLDKNPQAVMSNAQKKQQLTNKFKELDADGNGTLDFNEMHDLLLRGNPNFSEDEAWTLYKKCDVNGDGVVDFEEFLNYLGYNEEAPAARPKARTTDGRHAALAARGGPHQDDTEYDWAGIEEVFTNFAGKDMDGREWMKICVDAHIIDRKYTKQDVDIIFSKVVTKGQKRINFRQFQDALRHVAGKKGCTNAAIMEKVEHAHKSSSGTKGEYSKFYDDKSTYTGAATANENLGADHSHAYGRHEARQKEAADALGHDDTEDDEMWGSIESTFHNFAAKCGGDGIDGRTFLNLCVDTQLINKKFTKMDVDIVFSNVGRKAKKLNYEQVKAAVRQIAHKRGEPVNVVQQKVASVEGPKLHGVTETEKVKFYDDKSQYTGAAAEIFHREDGHGADKHAAQKAAGAAMMEADEGEHEWESCLITFDSYAGANGNLESREFLKMMVDQSLFDKKFTKQDVDTVFTSAKGARDVRFLDRETFKKAVRLVAKKKEVPTYQIQNTIAGSTGPVMHATQAEYSKFHDDKDTYTGAHVGK